MHFVNFAFLAALVVASVMIPLSVPAGVVCNIEFISFTAFVVASVVIPFFVPMCVWVAFLACAVTSTLNSSRMRSDATVGASKNTFAVFTVEHLVFTAISLSQWAFVAVLLK